MDKGIRAGGRWKFLVAEKMELSSGAFLMEKTAMLVWGFFFYKGKAFILVTVITRLHQKSRINHEKSYTLSMG